MSNRQPGMYYADYLDLDGLLNAQKPLSNHPDELHFIVVHQIHELWFKLALYHIERARAAMDADELLEAGRLLSQITGIIRCLEQTVRHLHTLPPTSFQAFRMMLAPGSGLQSYQFRELEFALGYRDPKHVAWVRRQLENTGDWQKVAFRLEVPSIAEAFDEVLDRHNIEQMVTLYTAPEEHRIIHVLAEHLADLEHTLLDWRFAHNQLVERTIGLGVVGTGGTTHDYLASRLKLRLFPRLWATRDELTRRESE